MIAIGQNQLRLFLKPYGALFRIRFVNSLQYRAAAISGMVTQFVWGMMLILAFIAFYREDPAAFPMTFEQTVAYIWLQQSFGWLFFVWLFDYSIFESIESGNISYEMVRPMDLYSRWFVQNAAWRIANCLLRAVPLLIIALMLPVQLRLILPADLVQMGLFLLSMILAFGVVLAFSMLIYISTFFTLNSMGVRIFVATAVDFLAGGYIPIPFFPDAVRQAVEWSPFGSMMNAPFIIFGGSAAGVDAVRVMLLQLFWLIVLLVIGRICMRTALRRVIAQGG